MIVRIQYQGANGSPWMKEYMEGKIARLERYLSPDALVVIEIIDNPDRSFSRLTVSTLRHDYQIDRDGDDLFEAFTSALDEATKILRRDHLRMRERVHRKFDDAIEL